ncbi:MAG: ATP-sensitive inward rectifier potassium channel 10 [Oscillatoriales cyanobacterium]|uniref:Ion channel n=1 Tax=Microcoleus anatoxicus PTRS2 TaxID=2705321 RepID=A0ABU8YQ10_9CYAN|nr:MAG: ATP-sensitive inward rectifier potassium channel 10 [Oscillatoriales cyanobacterium]TAD93884.1 MAG: ATP-sensitive inward rectifier potassium channel 10 [Oscillatoriales cyanobacterium]TAE01418.1 MAG: ATP-sensitive inward rectifier potassium channel 10 [Oscillatoriales cyanobacterium]TAF36541.1 MAG: ATP-sensitive inward rectifier potassium channel 10 [Oscillatoriales cyanobacterium]TAF70600.1 MAG: ATP-sensitive inward rectifier potassium channel 10 [Oscillatoriales cyanobacterium]
MKTNRDRQPHRLVSRKGQFTLNVVRLGLPRLHFADLYHGLLTLSWPRFFILISLLYVLTNSLFALAYLAGGNCIANARPGSFQDAFYFSVQTMATIGYGSMYPRNDYANTIVAIQAFFALWGVAMVTGLAFSRFSKPTARVIFSRVAAIAPFNGVQTLMYRTANQRFNQILEAQQRATLIRDEVTSDGDYMRRFYDLTLVRSQSPIFALTWTVMHVIDENSPLYKLSAKDLIEQQAEIVITLTGIDETVSQTIHARHSFVASEILWNMKFVDIISRTPQGKRVVDYTRFHDVKPVEENL